MVVKELYLKMPTSTSEIQNRNKVIKQKQHILSSKIHLLFLPKLNLVAPE